MLETADPKQAGFTLVELILAMAIFSFGLLVILTGFLALIGFYQNGVQSRAVQLSARNAINQVVIAGRGSSWFAYNGSTICMASGSIFYLDAVNHRLMQNAGWDSTSACPASPGGGVAVTNADTKVSAFIPEQADSFDAAGNPTPCTAGGCNPEGANPEDGHHSMRLTVRVTSMDPAVYLDGAGTSCKPTAPATCTITALSTTLTAGEF